MVVRWRCKYCGALHDGQAALSLLLATAFVPTETEEKAAVRPVKKLEQKKEVEEDEYEDLKLE